MPKVANRLTLFVNSHQLQFGLWVDEKLLHQQTLALHNNYLEAYFPFWKRLIKHPAFSWKDIKSVYCLNGPNKFALLRTFLVNLKLYRVFQPNWTFYVLDHLSFQVASAKLTISLITANKNHYYCGIYQNFHRLKQFQLLPNQALKTLPASFPQAVIVQNFAAADFLALWKTHWRHFVRLKPTEELIPLYLNPFSADKIKPIKHHALFPPKNRT